MSGAEATRLPLWRRLYAGWLAIAARFGEVQTLVILSLVYSVVLGPVALGMAAARRDLLHKRGLRAPGSVWSEADTVTEPDLERARHLF